MKIETTPLDNHEIKVNVCVDAADFEPFKKQAARKIAAQNRIPGFRPGKAPYEIVLRNHGETAIAQEALDIYLEKNYETILSEAKVEPGHMGRMDHLDQVDPPVFSIIVPLKPEVDLGEYRETREDFVFQEASDEDVQNALQDIKKNYATAEPFVSAAEEGCTVYVMLDAETQDPLDENGNTKLVSESARDFTIGEDTAPDSWPYMGFSNIFLGKLAGESVVSEYTFPEDYNVEQLRGKKAFFKAEIQSIKKMVLPEENLEIAKNFGEFETYEAFVTNIKERLNFEKKRGAEEEYIEKVMEKITEGAQIKFAPAALEEQVEESLNNLKNRLAQQGIDFEMFLKVRNLTLEQLIENEIKAGAEKQLKRNLVLQEFTKEEKIALDFKKIDEVSKSLESYASAQMAQAKTKKERDQIQRGMMSSVMEQIYMDSVYERLIAIAKGENPPIEPLAPEEKQQEAEETATSENVAEETSE